MRDALPILRRAAHVMLVEFVEGETPADEPATRLGLARDWRANHGIDASARSEPSAANPGEALLERAAHASADLIVMGGYGHSRLREWVLGGVTRHVLREMSLPVLMSR